MLLAGVKCLITRLIVSYGAPVLCHPARPRVCNVSLLQWKIRGGGACFSRRMLRRTWMIDITHDITMRLSAKHNVVILSIS